MTPTAALASAALAFALLAGCSTPSAPAAETTSITVAFSDSAQTARLPFGPHAAQSHYDGTSATHPAFYSAFDQLAQWAGAGHTLKLEPPTQYGFCLDRIDDRPAPGGCEGGAVGYWNLAVDGANATLGMDQVELRPGDSVVWTLVPLASASRAPDAPSPATAAGSPAPVLAVTVDPVPATRNTTVTVHGSLSHAAILSLDLSGTALPSLHAAGAWSTIVALPLGRSNLTVTADDGRGTATATARLVREAKGTMQVDFRGVPGHDAHDDAVWFDPDSFPAASYYEGQPVAHPAYADVHDLMAAWSAQTGVAVIYKAHPTFGQQVLQIDGVGDPTMNSAAFWCYKVDGTAAALGITEEEFHDGDVVSWSLGTVC
ncbi:MAG: hypothetical protein ABR562_06740 [Thermoplasmatota archaeon]|nr:DUF4430 domain-containing protein [Halobacteriales archaeon]